ncbi:MAG: VWA domain-containing protein, partial [Pirellulales bacterium]|nr:VWA domain-containing protein [Pirellulales bacterium]
QGPGRGGDKYGHLVENPFRAVKDHPLSTFSIDVDTASYANVRRFLLAENTLPPPDAVRIEELVNYFDYDYAGPKDDVSFAAHIEVAGCPWKSNHRLVRVGLKGKEMQTEARPASNLVFLLDVSGSMSSQDKLPLLVKGMKLLVEQLREQDRVAIVVYASAEGLALPSTSGANKQAILEALDRLNAGGSTNGGAGIELAYKIAKENFIKGGVNRVLLCTDGDFNVGATSTGDLVRTVEQKAKSGIFLSVLGFGRGNLNDSMMENISNKGNGNYAYIDGLTEARKVLVQQSGGTLVTIAKDVKIQIEFNPARIAAYRLIGYENRMLAAEDFNDDKKDAGEIGAGHTVTALYEIVPVGAEVDTPPVDDLKYQPKVAIPLETPNEASVEMLTLKLRYKQPDGDKSKLLQFPLTDGGAAFGAASQEFQFATSVAWFGMLLRGSAHAGDSSLDAVLETASSSKGPDLHGYRAEFLKMIRKAKELGKKEGK